MPPKKRILIAPLDWGLGHATRSVPIIIELLKNNIEVIIAADRHPLAFLQKEFPQIETIRLPGYEISYPSSAGNMPITMALQIPCILSKIREENKWLQKTIKEKKINGVISDQRFGLNTTLVPCAFITHQIMIKAPFFENILYEINKSFIDKYTECWIPDYQGPVNLSGDLSHKFRLPVNAKFIGPLSRFPKNSNFDEPNAFQYQLMAIISGPEPQRTIFEKIILSQLKKSETAAIVVRGLSGLNEHYSEGNTEIHSHLETNEMVKKIHSSEIIISRPGYSTIMDLAVLRKKKAVLIPTPGQTEQEYLAKFHYHKNHFFCTKQNIFNLKDALIACQNFHGIKEIESMPILKNIVKNFIRNC